MTAAQEGGEWSAARPGRTLPQGEARYPFYRRLGGPQGRSGRVENLVPTGIRSRTVQPVVSHYTNWATRPTFFLVREHYVGKATYKTPYRQCQMVASLAYNEAETIQKWMSPGLRRYPNNCLGRLCKTTRKKSWRVDVLKHTRILIGNIPEVNQKR